MPRAYSEDLRERIVRDVEDGLSRNMAARKYDVSVSFVVKLMQRWQAKGHCRPERIGGYKEHKLKAHEGRVREIVKEHPDMTLQETCALLQKEKIKVSKSALARFLDHVRLSYKKNSARNRAGAGGRQGGTKRVAAETAGS